LGSWEDFLAVPTRIRRELVEKLRKQLEWEKEQVEKAQKK
jgi:UDP-2,3-diacylglucosamine pyrophosphatase LpxH